MGLFRNNGNMNNAIMDVIRCDEPSYLIWKWHPEGVHEGDSTRENSIRWGSSLRVKTGEVAIFLYHKDGRLVQDNILGPYDSILKTENLPVISSILGLAYNGNTPFQAEVYFINLAEIIQIKFGVPHFDVFDPRFDDFAVPIAVRGVISFKISNYLDFIQKYQLKTFSPDEFRANIKAAVTKYVKSAVANAPDEHGIPVIQLEKKIIEINQIVENDIRLRLYKEFGVTVTSVDISDIEVDKTSEGYRSLLSVTKKQTERKVKHGTTLEMAAQTIDLATNTATAAVDVKEYQYAKHKKSQIGFIKGLIRGDGDLSAADTKPSFSSNVSKKVSDFAGSIGSKFAKKEKDETPPPLPVLNYHIAIDGNSVGPMDFDGMRELVSEGKMTENTLVWKKGMKEWAKAKDVDELIVLFKSDADTDEVPPIPLG